MDPLSPSAVVWCFKNGPPSKRRSWGPWTTRDDLPLVSSPRVFSPSIGQWAKDAQGTQRETQPVHMTPSAEPDERMCAKGIFTCADGGAASV